MSSRIPVFGDDDTLLFHLDLTDSGTHDVRAWPNEREIARLSERELLANPYHPTLLDVMLYRLADGRWCRCSWEHVRGQRLWAGRLVTARRAAELLNDPEFTLPQEWKEKLQSWLTADCQREADAAEARIAVSETAQPPILTGEDKTILAVLSTAGLALTFAQIVREAPKLIRAKGRPAAQQDGLRTLSETKLRERVPILEAYGLVGRPIGPEGNLTTRKGIGITDKGRALLENKAAPAR